MDTMFTDSVRGNGDIFYCNCAKNCVPRIVRVTLDQLSCGIGIWTMKGFENRNKQSKNFYKRKTNGKCNCCEQVLKGLRHRFMCS